MNIPHDIHTAHCCRTHGCKYGPDANCTVMVQNLNITGCELCSLQNERSLNDMIDQEEEKPTGDWAWREEIAKYLPRINIMSFLGPEATIKWLFEQVEIKKK